MQIIPPPHAYLEKIVCPYEKKLTAFKFVPCFRSCSNKVTPQLYMHIFFHFVLTLVF